MNQDTYFESVLPNGIRLLHRSAKSPVAHLALMVNTGSRDENPNENGLAHLIEHTIFKGTKNRKAYHILSCLDNVGGDLNAYTTKEETCIHASFLKNQYKRCFDLFSDIAFNSVFPPNELEKEKEVVLDEINSYRDTPSEEIFDEFENVLFRGHPLGRNILGTEESVKKLTRFDLLRFVRSNYATNQMVLASIGDISEQEFVKFAEHYFGDFKVHGSKSHRIPFEVLPPENILTERKSHLSHCMIGNVAFEYNHPQKLAMILLNNILGGPGMNSRLNLNIREKYGFAYSIESQYNAYSDTGVFSVYLGVDPISMEKAIKLIYKELDKLKNQKMGTMQMHHAQEQLIGQLALSYESGMNELLSVTHSHLLKEKIEPMNVIVDSIRKLKATDIQDVANLIFDRDKTTELIFNGQKDSEDDD